MPEQTGVLGQARPSTGNSEFNALMFAIRQVMGQMNTATLVEVVAVATTGRTAATGTVDVHPLVNQVTGAGQPIAHTTIFSLPYLRVQGGANAIICDPKVGDIGFCVFADHDISAVKATRKAATPETNRRFNMSDGFFLGGWNVTTPARYIVVDDQGITIEAGNEDAELNAGKFTINCDVEIVGKLKVTDDVTLDKKLTATGEVQAVGKNLSTHTHGGVTTGSGFTGAPV